MNTQVVLTIAGVLAAATTIIMTSLKVGKLTAILIGRFSINHIRRSDIHDDSFVGQEFKFNDEIAKSLSGIDATISEMQRSLDKNRVGNLRIELLQLIHNTPDKADIIEQVYENYISLGGNSYVKQVMKEWREIYGKKTIRRHITHENIEK